MWAAYVNRPCTLHTQTVSATQRDDMGDPIVETADTTTVCDLQPIGSAEKRGDLGTILTEIHRLFLLPGEPVDGWAEVTVAPVGADPATWDGTGDRYTLEGPPRPIRNPRTREIHHIEAHVRKVT